MSCFDLCHLERHPAVPRCHGGNITVEIDVEEDGPSCPKRSLLLFLCSLLCFKKKVIRVCGLVWFVYFVNYIFIVLLWHLIICRSWCYGESEGRSVCLKVPCPPHKVWVIRDDQRAICSNHKQPNTQVTSAHNIL